MKTIHVLGVLLAITCSGAQAFAQEPTCRACPATYIPHAELQKYIDRALATGAIDQQVRAIDIGKSNVDIGIIYRGRLDSPGRQSVAEHDFVSEVYYILDGAATLVTGPDLVGKVRRPADSEPVRILNGPGNGAESIANGVSHQLKAG